jgi:arabinofuranosyltransferase
LRALIARLLPPVVLVAFSWAFLYYQGFGLVDDAFISFRYVDNLVAGHGLVWNPGQPVEGYTNLLWLLLLAPFAALGYDLVLPAAILGTCFSVGTLELLRRLTARTLPQRPPLVHALPPLLLALNPSFAHWTTSGMETAAFCFFVLLAASALLEVRERRRPALVALAFCAAYLTRPEGAFVAGILLLAHVLFANEGTRRSRLTEAAVLALPLAGVVLIHVGIRLSYYGHLLPNTFYAKVVFGELTWSRGVHHLLAFFTCAGLLVLPGLLLLRAEAPLRRLLASGYLLLAAYLLYLLMIGGDHPAWNRFYLPLLALPLVGLGELVARLAAAVRARRPQLVAMLAALFIVLLTIPGWRWGESSQINYIRASKIGSEWLLKDFFGPSVPTDAFIAASGVGYIGYYTPNRILDTWGLNDTHIAHRPVRPNPTKKFGHDKTDWVYVLSVKPDYIYTFATGRPTAPFADYEVCWPSKVAPLVAIYRRVRPLREQELSLGMPPGMKRTRRHTPPCTRRPTPARR